MRRVGSTNAGRATLAIMVLSLIGLLIFGLNLGSTYAFDDAVFSTLREPVGVAGGFDSTGTSQRIYVTSPFDGNPRRIYVIDSRGRERRFHTLPNRPGSVRARDDIAVSPGAADSGFARDEIYVTQGRDVYKITVDGRTRTHFGTIPDCNDATTYLTFDDIGSFGKKLLLTCGGRVYSLGPLGGDAVEVANLGVDLTGPDVAPESVVVNIAGVAFRGPLLVASPQVENGLDVSKVYAVTATKAFTSLATIPGAKAVHIVPPIVCTIGTGNQPGAFFFARRTANEVRKLPATSDPDPSKGQVGEDLAGNEGRILVTTNNTNTIVWFHPSGTFTVTPFHVLTVLQDNGGGDFCPRLRVKILIKPGTYQKYEPDSNGKIPVVILGSEEFDVTTIQQSSLRFGDTGNELSLSHCDNSLSDTNKDGWPDLKCHFTFSLTELDPSDTQAVLTGIKNPPFEGFD